MTPPPGAAVTTRALNPRTADTRRRLVDAGVALASEQDLDAFTMRDVAAAAGLSPATAYTYFASKEHLLAEVYAEFVSTLTERLRARPPSGSTSLDRVRDVLRRATDGVAASPRLAAAFTRAVASSDPSVALIRPTIGGAFRTWLDLALGDDPLPDRDEIVITLELVLYAAMLTHTHRSTTVGELQRTLDDAARLLLDPSRRSP